MSTSIRGLLEAAFWLNLIVASESNPWPPLYIHAIIAVILILLWARDRGKRYNALDREEQSAFQESWYGPLVSIYMPLALVMFSSGTGLRAEVVRYMLALFIIRFHLFRIENDLIDD